MNDITDLVVALARAKLVWSRAESEDVVREVAESLMLRTLWDSDAGEGWAMLMEHRDDALVAYVYMHGPLVISVPTYANHLRPTLPQPVGLLLVSQFASAELSCTRAALVAGFGPLAADVENISAFSAQDLWFHTI